ncbi:alpha/beta hydrolase [Streptomyces sp. NPDC020742]|uniref:alpha/beta hydrolase n=1 Tax=Streptomyces sp. NPDC020742 TaxID=3154897 RepID=UPI0033C950B7
MTSSSCSCSYASSCTCVGFPHDAAGVDRRTAVRSAVVAAGALLAGRAGTARAASRPSSAAGLTLHLPPPTGPHPIGVTPLYLVDRGRRDPWDSRIPVRELMASVFYPARTVHGVPTAPQMTEGAAARFAAIDTRVHGLPAGGVDWAATRSHAHVGAPVAAGRWPVLLYSPGGGDPRTLGTSLAEELAGHGHVVVAVDHPGDASEVEFPTTTPYRRDLFRTTVFRDDPRKDPGRFRAMIDTRIADLRFVRDQLALLAEGRPADAAGRALPEHLGRALDLRRVGLYGHSAGGTAVAEALYEDRRFAAAVNLEGYLDRPVSGGGAEPYPVAAHGVDRPLLLLGSQHFLGPGSRRELARSWSAVLDRSRGYAHRRRIARTAHWAFTDYAALVPPLQAAGLLPAAARNALVGTAGPAETVPAVRTSVRGFFARHLPRCPVG